MKKLLSILVIISTTLVMHGCWGYSDPDQTAYVLALGVDEGEENVLTLTAQIAVPKNIAGGGGGGAGGGGGDKSTMIVSVETPTIIGGLNMFGSFLERRPTLKHTKAIVFSSGLARNNMETYLAPLVRYHEFRRNTHILVSDKKAKDIIKDTQPIMEDNPAKYIETLTDSRRHSGFFPESRVNNFYNSAKSIGAEPVAIMAGINEKKIDEIKTNTKKINEGSFIAGKIPREGGNKLEFMGAAVFRDGKMVGEINGQENVVVDMIKNTFREGVYSLPDPNTENKYIILSITSERNTDIKINMKGEVPRINVTVPLDASFLSIQSNIHYEKPDKIKEVEKSLEKTLKGQADKLVKKTQQEFESDIFGFGNEAKSKFLTLQQWKKYNWLENYPNYNINTTFDVNIRRIGLIRDSSKMNEGNS
ncbi:MAG: Ger(x)C family spore germination protein [Clostridiales bacterium]|nr:Ger(x)C family spore germination protein [Clostridiales bacterium]MCF8022154.1 Ger(x)C family spore germination protein [Clostridiales bacterium]